MTDWDMYPSSPGASSSKVTLDRFDSAENAGPRKRVRCRTMRTGATAAVLAMCIPYVSAAANGALSTESSLHLQPVTRALDSDSPTASSGLFARNRTLAVLTLGSGSSMAYTIPEDMVRLEQSFQPGFIVLSYCIAFVGSLCTLELLIRRTTNNGWKNKLLLFSAGLCFGAVSTFSMHFVFNNALTLSSHTDSADNKLYLSYNPGFTILSLVASVAAMTMAFFVMGTRVSDWYCTPGGRRRRREQRRSSAGHGAATKERADEYRSWKEQQKKVLGQSKKGIGHLMAEAGKVAKWSLVSPSSRNSDGSDSVDHERSFRKSMESGKAGWAHDAGMEDEYEPTDDELIKRDKRLAEIDFRLGRAAAKAELERRHEYVGATITTSTTLSGASAGEMAPELSTAALVSSAMPASPSQQLPMYYSSLRRGSIPAVSPPVSSDLFTPGFNFPPKIDTQSTAVAADAAPSSAPATQRTDLPPWSAGGDPNPYPYTSAEQFNRRRASLPCVAGREAPTLGSSAAAQGYLSTLTRIASLPEGEPDATPASVEAAAFPSTPDDGLFGPGGKKLSLDSKLGEAGEEGDVSLQSVTQLEEGSGRTGRRRARAKPALSKLEKFLGLDVVTPGDIVKVCITGTIAGFGVAAMHYIGQASITGIPYVAYKAEFVVGSVVIACGAVCIALYIMFIMLRPKLKHNLFAKLIVAAILSIAVCCMHFCGMMGTIYAWPRGAAITAHDMLTGANRAITAIVASLAFVACVCCFIFFGVEAIQARRERNRRRRVVVAAVMLDQQDRILVNSTDGLLPMCDIASLSTKDIPTAKNGSSRRFGGSRTASTSSFTFTSGSTILGIDLTTAHDAFISALKMSWFWRNPQVSPSLLPGGIPGLATGARATAHQSPSIDTAIAEIRRGSLGTVGSGMSRPARLSVAKFLERFTMSAADLAVRLTGQRDGIRRIGVLYDQILTTGWVKLNNNTNDTVSKGQLIFLVRRVASSEERTDLLSRHFIWAEASAVANSLQKTLSVPAEHLTPLLEDLCVFADSTSHSGLMPATLYAGVAVVQATPFDGLRILLEQSNRSRLPMREICSFSQTSSTSSSPITPIDATSAGALSLSGSVEEIGEALTWLEGMSLLSVIARNVHADADTTPGGPRVAQLLLALERAVVPMLDEMLTAADMEHILPRLTLYPVLVPLTPGSHRPAAPPPTAFGSAAGYVPPYMVVFYAHYDVAVNTFTDQWLPFSLFRAQNACVMAPRIAWAEQHEEQQRRRAAAAGVTLPSASGGWTIEGRRPSKVQFDTTTGGAFGPDRSLTVTPTGRPISADDGAAAAAAAHNMFNGYTFPARSGRSTAPTSPYDEKDPDAPHVSTPRHRSPSRGFPGRSSLAKGRANAGAALATEDIKEKDGYFPVGEARGRVAPGVDAWDPDWLDHLMRTKLRADPLSI